VKRSAMHTNIAGRMIRFLQKKFSNTFKLLSWNLFVTVSV
jgi:hypothetical protein